MDTDGRFVYEPDPEEFCDACALIIKIGDAILESKIYSLCRSARMSECSISGSWNQPSAADVLPHSETA